MVVPIILEKLFNAVRADKNHALGGQCNLHLLVLYYIMLYCKGMVFPVKMARFNFTKFLGFQGIRLRKCQIHSDQFRKFTGVSST